MSGPFYFDEAAADRAVEFFPACLVHIKGEWAGQPFELSPWELDVVRNLFGWKQKSDGLRRYREVYVEIPRKNAKSTFASGLGLLLLLADDEPGAEVYAAAVDRSQAGIVFEPSRMMVEKSPELSSRATTFRRSIVVASTASKFEVLSADVPTKHGLNAHGVIVDELHALPSRGLVDVLKTSTGSRRQPVILYITTAGYDRNSICWEKHVYAEKVRDGVIDDPTFLPVIYDTPIDADWTDPKVWAKANPNLRISVKYEYLEKECKAAQETPGYQNTFRRLHLNQWTEQASRWLDMARWDLCGDALPPESELEDHGCWGGLDLAATTDVCALVWGFWLGENVFGILPRFFIPEETIALRSRRDRVPYDVWAREGQVIVTPGNVVDYDLVVERILEDGERFGCHELAYDPWNATHVANRLQDEGMTIVPFRQGWKTMSPPTKELEKLVVSRKLRHGGNPVLRWMAGNVAVAQDPAGNLKPARDKSFEKIDGIVAVIMALGRAMLEPEETGGSIYEEEGLFVV